jgi:Mrp family chromosome partitioning ATPase
MVDGTIIVVVGGKTPREALHEAREILTQVNARILGVVINRVDIRRSDYNSYHYRYHYYYGEEKNKKLPAPREMDPH